MEGSGAAVHQYDPAMAPDSDFEPGVLAHLVAGNRGRMLDRRRTPVQVVELKHATGQWVCEVLAFEDRGARWLLPFETAGSFQFARGSQRAGPSALRRIRAAVRAFDQPAEKAPSPRARAATEQAIRRLRREAAQWLEAESRFFRSGGTLDPAARRGSPLLWRDLEVFLTARGLWDIERELAATLVSNPASGEMVKVHAMVLADLGLAGYHGTVVRDPASLEAPWTPERRARHILSRLAFLREVFGLLGIESPLLYRAVSREGALDARRPATFVHATFSLQVAMSLFGPDWEGRAARLDRQHVPVARLFMTHLETEAMNRQYHEAEAILLEDPQNSAF